MYATEDRFFLNPISTIPNRERLLTAETLTTEAKPLSDFEGFEDLEGVSIVRLKRPDADHCNADIQIVVHHGDRRFSISRANGSPAYRADNVLNWTTDSSLIGCVREGLKALTRLEESIDQRRTPAPEYSYLNYRANMAVATGKYGDPQNWDL